MRRFPAIAAALFTQLLGLVLGLATLAIADDANPPASPTSRSNAASDGSSPVLARLEAAVRAHPGDPDLAWAYARELAEAGQAERATAHARSYLSRWPSHRPTARVEIARALLEAEAPEAASVFLDEAVATEPTSGLARFYRALRLRQTGQLAAADREFRVAARLEPALRAETLLVRALGLFELDRETEAVGLLSEILRLDPTSDTATRARLLLRQSESTAPADRFRANAYMGFEWDDNVTLESAENEVPASNREDFRGIWGIGLAGRAIEHDRAGLTLGYRFDQSEYDDLDGFSLLTNTVFASGSWRLGARLSLRLDAVAYHALQDLDDELTGGTIRPSAIVSLGPSWGAIRLLPEFQIAEFHDRPTVAIWERDSYSYGLGLEYFLPLRADRSSLTVSGAWQRSETQAEPSGFSDAFDGDFDHDSLRARAVASLVLPFDLRSRIEASYEHDRYHNDNFSHFVDTLGGLRKREDDIVSGRISLSAPIVRHVRFEVYWRGTRRISNVDLFDYDKQIAGAVLRVSTN